MRWPFRRRGSGSEPEPAAGSAVPAVPVAGGLAERPSREWALLPPLPVTVSRSAPLVIGPAPVLPALPGPRAVAGPPVDQPAGRVEGMAMVLPPRPKVSAPAQSPVDTERGTPPVPVV